MSGIVRHMRYGEFYLGIHHKTFGRTRSRGLIADWCDQRNEYRIERHNTNYYTIDTQRF